MPAPKELDPSTSLAALYGAKLRKLRVRAGWSQKELGDRIPIAHSRIAQYELGKETPKKDVSDQLDKLLGAGGDLSELWVHLDRSPPTDAFLKYKEYEAKATAVHKYLAHHVPGLLQTEAYAREVMRQSLPWWTADEIEERVAARLARRSILDRVSPPLYWVVLDEAVVRRPVGGLSVMREQLAYLLEASRRPNVELQVLPFATGGHGVMGGSVTRLSFDNAPDVVYLEGGPSLTDMVRDRKAVAQHSHRYDRVHAAALSPTASGKWIEKALEELASCEPT
ncbi:helix-turn-helix domain-containing protein [Streptomyces griseocarneus]|uniref:helix-turn-helix domain-containing protein n=1 Tax=Streptomyces griseocarneus TaxID=51201 RepID=UPI00167D4DFB|nr:helix-turn-helix transcriptional regulator [Streptomyces griseocarneus]MBZ6473908.1 helix-turn-helix transcriptional regulator [Streptomyces griseocarneus]GHG65847.1 transcriptional regulator [Streptomyces griseocarneus]